MLNRFLVGITPRDPATFVVTVLVIVTAGVLASMSPAWRAIRADPVQSLRAE